MPPDFLATMYMYHWDIVTSIPQTSPIFSVCSYFQEMSDYTMKRKRFSQSDVLISRYTYM